MAGLAPAIHVFLAALKIKTWMPGTRPGMTSLLKAGVFAVRFVLSGSPATIKWTSNFAINRQNNNRTSMFPRISALSAFLAGLFGAAMLAIAPSQAGDVAFGPRPGASLSVEKLAPIEAFINGEVAAGRIPGAIVLVQQHGKPVYLKAFGMRDPDQKIPLTLDSIFPIHSVTKTITSVAAMMLVDRGKLALSDPVSKYIPSIGNMKVGIERKDESGKTVLDLVPPIRPINIEDILLHTSGITYGFYGEGLVKAAYDGIYLGDFDNAGFAERIAKVPLAEQPRTLWDYGHSIDVLGRVIEVASGQSLYQFEKTTLLDPLGMTTTKFFLTDPAERARYAQPLDRDRHVERDSLHVTRWESGGGEPGGKSRPPAPEPAAVGIAAARLSGVPSGQAALRAWRNRQMRIDLLSLLLRNVPV